MRSLKSSIESSDNPARGGPDSRDHSTAHSLKGVDSSFARSTHVVASSNNPARGGPDSRDRSTAHPSGLKNPSDPVEGIPPKQERDHPPKTLPVPTPRSKPEKLAAKLTPLQKRRLKTLKEKGKTPKVPTSLPKLDTTATEVGVNPLLEPTTPDSPKDPGKTTPESASPEQSPSSITTMSAVKELADALTEKLKDIGRHPTVPLPQFKGKKGEDPNDHCMKVEDYFAMFDIITDEDQK